MKRLALLSVILIATCVVAMAQPRAIGGRLTNGVGVSYQHGFGESNMLQVDVDFPVFGLQAAVTYNWIFPISSWSHAGEWNWYAGVGGGAGYYWGWWGTWGSSAFVGVAGMIGVEYTFNFPLQLSLDYRPVFGPSFEADYIGFHVLGCWSGAIGLGVRYKF